MAYVEARFGASSTRALASVVVTAAGPPELEQAFERFTGISFEQLEEDYKSSASSYYRGLHEQDIEEILDPRWLDVSLRCAAEHTFGPLPDAQPGMYRSLRLVLDEPSTVDVELIAPERVSVQFVDVRRERSAGVVVDFFHPRLSGRREHEIVHGGEQRSLQLPAGTHLVVISQAGDGSSDAFLSAVPRTFPRE
jgi:hypothetical protein